VTPAIIRFRAEELDAGKRKIANRRAGGK